MRLVVLALALAVVSCAPPPESRFECAMPDDTFRYASPQRTNPLMSMVVGKNRRYLIFGFATAKSGEPIKVCKANGYRWICVEGQCWMLEE